MDFEVKPYAKEARNKVGRFLSQELGFKKKTPIRFYKHRQDMAVAVFMEKPSVFTYAYCGIIPYYLPNSTYILNGVRIENKYKRFGYRNLTEYDDELTANRWANATMRILMQDVIPFFDTLTDPHNLINYLTHPNHDQRLAIPPYQAAELTAYTYAYLGDANAAKLCLTEFRDENPDYAYPAEIHKIIDDFSNVDFDKDEYFEEIIKANKIATGFKQ